MPDRIRESYVKVARGNTASVVCLPCLGRGAHKVAGRHRAPSHLVRRTSTELCRPPPSWPSRTRSAKSRTIRGSARRQKVAAERASRVAASHAEAGVPRAAVRTPSAPAARNRRGAISGLKTRIVAHHQRADRTLGAPEGTRHRSESSAAASARVVNKTAAAIQSAAAAYQGYERIDAGLQRRTGRLGGRSALGSPAPAIRRGQRVAQR